MKNTFWILGGKFTNVKLHCSCRFYLAVREAVRNLAASNSTHAEKGHLQRSYFKGHIILRNLGISGVQNIQ